ncbi:hypothetical protein J3456_15950 [Sulfitobacter sp. NFXS29]|uniref:hypothetical protein n=1 Tax=Sulfitobacter sp. NFXS29 TaxID=2818438 RepID=UPI0032DFC85F
MLKLLHVDEHADLLEMAKMPVAHGCTVRNTIPLAKTSSGWDEITHHKTTIF